MLERPVIRVLFGRERQWLEADIARRIGGLDEAHGIGDSTRTAGSEKDDRRSRVAGGIGRVSVFGDDAGLHFRWLMERWRGDHDRQHWEYLYGASAPQRGNGLVGCSFRHVTSAYWFCSFTLGIIILIYFQYLFEKSFVLTKKKIELEMDSALHSIFKFFLVLLVYYSLSFITSHDQVNMK